jgi:TonB family protein
VAVGGFGTSFVGTIDREGVLRVIRSKQSIIRRCYEKQLLYKKDLGGRVVVRFEIGEKGKVLSASIDQSTLNDAGVEACLKNELVTWEFPEPPANSVAEVLFPFNFQNKD